MKRRAALAGLLAFVCTGCPFIVEGPGVLAGSIMAWDAPGIAQPPAPGPVLHGAVGWDGTISTGVSVYGNEAGAELISFESTMDLGAWLFNYDGVLGVAPSVRPVVGAWAWSDSPERFGLASGWRIGVTYMPRKGRYPMVRIEYGWITCHDTSGDDNAKLKSLAFSVAW